MHLTSHDIFIVHRFTWLVKSVTLLCASLKYLTFEIYSMKIFLMHFIFLWIYNFEVILLVECIIILVTTSKPLTKNWNWLKFTLVNIEMKKYSINFIIENHVINLFYYLLRLLKNRDTWTPTFITTIATISESVTFLIHIKALTTVTSELVIIAFLNKGVSKQLIICNDMSCNNNVILYFIKCF